VVIADADEALPILVQARPIAPIIVRVIRNAITALRIFLRSRLVCLWAKPLGSNSECKGIVLL
jgi:hypothetical protein